MADLPKPLLKNLEEAILRTKNKYMISKLFRIFTYSQANIYDKK